MSPGSRYNFDVYLFFKSKYYVTIAMIANNEQKKDNSRFNQDISYTFN